MPRRQNESKSIVVNREELVMILEGISLEKVSKYIKILNESGLMIDKAFLFGNAIRNEQHEGSDIDVMLVSRRFDNDDVSPLLKIVKKEGIPEYNNRTVVAQHPFYVAIGLPILNHFEIDNKKELSSEQREELLNALNARFEKNMNRHKDLYTSFMIVPLKDLKAAEMSITTVQGWRQENHLNQRIPQLIWQLP